VNYIIFHFKCFAFFSQFYSLCTANCPFLGTLLHFTTYTTQAGIDLNLHADDGTTPLMMAAIQVRELYYGYIIVMLWLYYSYVMVILELYCGYIIVILWL
jgi:hypothetical protein